MMGWASQVLLEVELLSDLNKHIEIGCDIEYHLLGILKQVLT